MNNNSTFLFARPSFVEGVARVMDLGSSLQVYNGSKTPEEADLRALKNDWASVGSDIINAAKEYERGR